MAKTKQKTKQKSKSRVRGFKIPTTKIIKSALRKCSHTFLEESVMFLLKAVPKKVKISFLVRLEKAKKKTSKTKRKSKTEKTKRKSTKRKTKRKSKSTGKKKRVSFTIKSGPNKGKRVSFMRKV